MIDSTKLLPAVRLLRRCNVWWLACLHLVCRAVCANKYAKRVHPHV